MAEVALAVTGGIAAYKSIDVLRILQRRGHGVSVLMTRNAERFVTTGTFAALSGRPVGTRLFGSTAQMGYDHLDFGRRADLILVCPATANFIAEMAHGLGRGLVATTLLAFEGPVVVAPAMNPRMLTHPATAANIATLRSRGVDVVPPSQGILADGDVGPGRLADPIEICDRVDAALGNALDMLGTRALVSAGGTYEPIDAVRFVGNRSSGRMGWAVAEQLRDRGADVTVLACNVTLPRRPDITYIDTPTAADLHRETTARAATSDVVVMVAAVADYRPVTSVDGKIDKSSQDAMELRLERTPDILTEIAESRHDGQVIVGFAAEHGPEGLNRARDKRTRKNLDIIVHNDVSVSGIGFGAEDNTITIIGPDGEKTFGPAGKDECALQVVDAVHEHLRPN